MWEVHFHLEFSLCEFLFLRSDSFGYLHWLLCNLLINFQEVFSYLSSRVFHKLLGVVRIELCALCQNLARLVKPVGVLVEVASELLLYGLEECRVIFSRHHLGVVLHHCGCQFLIKCIVPLAAVILELKVLRLWIGRRALQWHLCIHTHGTCEELCCASERFWPIA